MLSLGLGQLVHPTDAKTQEANRQPASSCFGGAAQDSIAIHAPDRATSLVSFCDGRALPNQSSFSSPSQPLSLTSGDFDEDGVPDLVSGSGLGKSGSVTVYRGNVGALWPYGPAFRANPPPAFFPNGRTFAVPEAPDLIAAGDFDADGHWDIVTAHRGSDSLYFLRGDGHGGFQPAKRIALTGTVTALISGEINRVDGLTDLIVAVNSTGGARVLVFESPRGALGDPPEIFTLPAPATALALGRFDGNALVDLAVGAGNDLIVIHARNRKLSLGPAARAAVAPATITVQHLGFAIRALTGGDFTGAGAAVAALGDDGTIHILEHAVAPGSLLAKAVADPNYNPTIRVAKSGAQGNGPALGGRLTPGLRARLQALRESAQSESAEWTERSAVALPSGFSQANPRLITGRVSGSRQQDILVPDEGSRRVHIVSNATESPGAGAAQDRGALPKTRQPMRVLTSLEATSAPAAVLPMRLNQHGLSGLVIQLAGQSAPILMPHDVPPANIFTVTNTSDAIIMVGPQYTGPDGSLRKALYDVSQATGTSAIVFNIPTSDPGYNAATGTFLIQPLSESAPNTMNNFALNPINNTVTIDGYTQPGASPNTLANGDNAKILIQIDGGKATTPGGSGLSPFEDVGSIYRGMALTGWTSGDISTTNGMTTESGAWGIEAGGVADFIEGNFIGIGTTGKSAAPNYIGIFADGGPGFGNTDPGNIIGGTTPQARNILSANELAGITISSIALEVQLKGNFIGLDSSGSKVLPNGIDGAGGNGATVTYGGTLPGDGNVITGNLNNVDLNDITNGFQAMDSQVQGNLLGTDATGTMAPASGTGLGVSIVSGAVDELIGGTTPAARNIISGNYDGVYVFDSTFNNVVQGNYIGTDITGSKALGNAMNGFDTGVDNDTQVDSDHLVSAGDTFLGGSVPGAGNLISGNVLNGVAIEGASLGAYDQFQTLQGNTILGNLIGTDATGKLAVPNQTNGVSLTSGSTNNVIGGSEPGSGNLIADNGSNGVLVDPGNGAPISGAGFANDTVANTILSNKGAGVRVVTGAGNRISQNSIFANGMLGIDIDIAGENANSNCNSATNGANNLQNSPVLTTGGSGNIFITATATDPNGNTSEFSNAVPASSTGNAFTLLGTFNSAPSTSYTIEFFSSPVADASGFGQGQTYLGNTVVTTSASCAVSISDPIDTTEADMAVTLTKDATEFDIGPDFGFDTFTGTVTNNGPATAHKVVFTDVLPAGLTISSAYCDVASCQSPVTTTLGTCSISGQTITCDLGTMAPGATAMITIPVTAVTTGSPADTASVSAMEADPNLANNMATLAVTVNYPAPYLDHLDPTDILAGSPNTLLTIYGFGLIPSSTVTVGGTPVPITAVLDNQGCDANAFTPATFCTGLQVVVPAALLATAGTPAVEVTNPDPGPGGFPNSSSDLTLNIDAACVYSIEGDTDPTVTAFFSPEENDGTPLIPEFTDIDTNAPTCGWTAVSSVPWATVIQSYNEDSSGNELNETGKGTVYGSGEFALAIAPNTGASRSGSVVINNQTLTFTQDGGAACGISLVPTIASPTAAGGSATVAITTGDPSTCVEFVVPEASWITVPQASQLLSGSATATYIVAPNTGAPRTGYVLVGGAVVTVNQAAPSCYFTIDSNSSTIPVNGGTGTINVTASSPSCAYTATSSDTSKVSITSGASHTGSGAVKYSAPANAGGPQTTTITIGDGTDFQTFTVNQVSAFTCSFSLSPASIEVPSQGTSNFILLNASFGFCKWTATSSDPTAVAINGTGVGTGSAAVYYSVAQNTTGSPRTLTVLAGCQTFTINQDAPLTSSNNPVPTLTSLSPTSVVAGSGAFTLTVNGTNFINGSTVNFNGVARTTTFVSATKLTAAILATDVATAGTPPVTVTSPTPGGGTSNAINFTITAANNPAPTITTLSPSSIAAGSAAFTLTINGTNFISASTVTFNGAAKTATYVSSSQLTISVLAADVATAGTAPVIVTNPTPGGGTSNTVNFSITAANNPAPTITTLSPSSIAAGSAAFTLTINGTNFISASTVTFNGAAKTATFVSSSKLTISILAADVATASTAPVIVTNPTPGGGTSNTVNFSITAANNPAPTITTLSPSSVAAGSAAFTLTINGTNFISASTVTFNGAAKTATFVSASQLTISVLAADVATAGTAPVIVTNPSPGGGTSNTVNFSITAANNPAPTITTLSPSSIAAGSAAFTLTVNGTNFVAASVINFGGAAETTTFVSATQLTTTIAATSVATAGTAGVTVTNPSPGGGTSNSVTFTISTPNNPAPTITTLSPSSVAAGSAAFTLTINGTNFISASTVTFNGAAKTVTYVSASQLTISILAADVATAGTAAVTVTNPTPGGGTSNTVNLTITAPNNPVPTITSLSPTSVVAGSAAFTLTVNGTNFLATSGILFGSKAETTTFVSSTQLSASIAAGDIATAGTVTVTVSNPTPGGGTSNGASFTITAAAAPGVLLTPTTIAFPDTVSGVTSAAKTVTLTNSGNADLTISGVSIAGTNPSDFSQTNGCVGTVVAGASCTLQVTFTPSSVAAFSATLSIADNASGSPQTVALTGNGVAAPSFTLSSSTPNQVIAPGGSALYSITVSSQNGSFSSPVTLSATGLPPGATAIFSPASITPGSESATSQLTIQTAATSAAVAPSSHGTGKGIAAAALPMFAVLLVFWRRRRNLARPWLAICLLLATSFAGIATLTGCGGGFSLPEKTAVTYNITITGTSGSITQSTTVQLTVQ
jgi:hypothetical protein